MRFFPTSLALVVLVSAATVVGCEHETPDSSDDGGDSSGNGGGGSSSGGAGGGSGNASGASSGGANTGGAAPTGGAAGNATGGANTGGATTGGAAPTGGVGGTVGTGGTSTGGATTGGTSTGGMGGTGGMPLDVDQNGKRNAAPGTMTLTAQDYLRLGEIRLLNNNWGSEDLGCTAPMSVFVNQDRSFGWRFNRGDCDTAASNQHPDFPQVEFGIHPFGVGNALATSPDFSSTTLLPLQIKNITSASVTLQNLVIQLTRGGSWNITFEFWLSTQNPTTPGNAGVHTELMTFWGWQFDSLAYGAGRRRSGGRWLDWSGWR